MADINTLAGWIALVRGEALELRALGVLAIGVEGCSVTFAPLVEVVAAGDVAKPDASAAEHEHTPDPLHDPHSYPGGVVPGFKIERLDHMDPEEM